MISIVYSTKKNKPEYIEHLKNTSGIHKIEIVEIVNDGEMSLTQAYNKGLKETTNNIVVFCHDDIIFDLRYNFYYYYRGLSKPELEVWAPSPSHWQTILSGFLSPGYLQV